MLVHDFASADEFLSGGRSKNDRPLENNTRLIARPHDQIAVKLHDTDVITYCADGRRVLNSGGWLTVTTKDRINRYLGNHSIRIASDRGRWFVYRIDSNDYSWNKLSLFYDGMVIMPDWTVYESKLPSRKQINTDNEMTRKIDNFVSGFARRLSKGMPNPSSGDCWYCVMRTENNQSLGDASSDNSHLREHIKERYYVPALAYNAIMERGYRNPAFILSMTETSMGGPYAFTRGFRFSLRRYLRKRLMPHLAHR